MENRPLQYTVKIFGEGFTEWFYFDGLRSSKRFRFSLEPELPTQSRSSYQQNLKLIEKELKKSQDERADAIFLVIDTDTIAADRKKFAAYLSAKAKYEKQGVIFIESHPCIELWFIYHMMEKFSRSNAETYDDLLPMIEKTLPGYSKTAGYYKRNTLFRERILMSDILRSQAITNAEASCSYKPIEYEICNYTQIHKPVMFFNLLQKFAELRASLSEILRKPLFLSPIVDGTDAIIVTRPDGHVFCSLKVKGCSILCIMENSAPFTIPLDVELSHKSELVQRLAENLK